MGNKYMKKRTYRFASANEEVPPAPGSPEEEIAILQYLDEVKPQKKTAATIWK